MAKDHLKNVAFIILAHEKPENLRLLVEKLHHPNSKIYVHIDLKSDFELFKSYLDNLKVIFVQKRVSVYWAGFSMVEAIMNSLNQAKNEGEHSYYCLLSGVDFPAQPIEDIITFYNKNDKCFIDCIRISPDMKQNRYHRYLHKYTEEDNRYRNSRTRKKLCGPIKWYHRARIGIKRRLIGYRQFFNDLTPYCGSAWWSLPQQAVDYFLTYIERRPELVEYLKYSKSPEEIIFSTVLMNSQFSKLIEADEDNKFAEIDALPNNLRFVDWNNHREKPAILELTDLNNIRVSEAHFIRKVDLVKSKALIEKLTIY